MGDPGGEESSLTSYQRIMAASSGAICTALLMTPLDVVKIRLQRQRHPAPTGECFLYSNGLMDHICRSCSSSSKSIVCDWYDRPGQFTGTLDAFYKITRHEGVRSLWSGLSPTLLMAVPTTVFYFSTYDWLLLRMQKTFTLPNLLPPILSGMTARAMAVTLVAPLEVIRTKMQSEHMSMTELGSGIRASLSSHGWRALWLGWVPTLWRDVPFSAIYWCCYETVKSAVLQRTEKDHVSFSLAFGSGAISGTIAAILTNPFDVIKTKRQVELGTDMRNGKSTIFYMRRLVEERGLPALWSGIIPRIAKVAPACAIMIGSYEYFKQYFKRHNQLLKE